MQKTNRHLRVEHREVIYRMRKAEKTQAEIRNLGNPFDEELRAAGMAIVPIQVGQNMLPTILPLVDGKPVSLEEYQQLRRQGEISEEQFAEAESNLLKFEKEFSLIP